MVLVDKEYRGQGVSKALLANIFKKLGDCKSIKLDATPEGQKVYQKLDFKEEYSHSKNVKLINKECGHLEDDILPEPVEVKHIREIIALDEFIFGANRTQLIKYLVNEYPGKGLVTKKK